MEGVDAVVAKLLGFPVSVVDQVARSRADWDPLLGGASVEAGGKLAAELIHVAREVADGATGWILREQGDRPKHVNGLRAQAAFPRRQPLGELDDLASRVI
jgi:hypothetical protein